MLRVAAKGSYSAFAPDVRITLPQRSRYSFMNAAICAGELPRSTMLMSLSRAATSGCFKASLIAAESLLAIAGG